VKNSLKLLNSYKSLTISSYITLYTLEKEPNTNSLTGLGTYTYDIRPENLETFLLKEDLIENYSVELK